MADSGSDQVSAVDWLLGGRAAAHGVGPLLGGLAERANSEGLALVHAALVVEALHPMLSGTRYVWRADTSRTTEEPRFHGFLATGHTGILATDLGEPPDEMLRVGITPNPNEGEPGFVAEVRGLGATELVALPLAFSDGTRHTVSWATDRHRGFGAPQVRDLLAFAPALASQLEIIVVRQVAATLLSTYLGTRSGAQVLSGRVQRGDGETIHAVIWISDLRGFSGLSETLAHEELIASLNAHFERMVAPIKAFGGEVLKFMGDGLLAIFPVPPDGDASTPADAAIKAARSTFASMAQLNGERKKARLPLLRFGIGLHLGELVWGNIGSPDRLDFTAIGPAVNLASRLEQATKRARVPLVASAAFAQACGDTMVGLGARKLRGLKEPVELFTLPDLAPRT